jgi:hypothetical protein
MKPGVPQNEKHESGFNLKTIINKAASPSKPSKNKQKPRLILHEGETLHKILHPHPLSFYDMYFIFVYVILVSLLFISAGYELSELLGNPMSFILEFLAPTPSGDQQVFLPVNIEETIMSLSETASEIDEFVNEYSPVMLWITLLIAVSVVFSVLKISWKWIGILAGVGFGSLLLSIALELPGEASYYFGIFFSIIGIILVDKYRRSHVFYVTDYRIITEVTFIDHKRNELGYDKINNLILDRTLIARIFNFGTIIPVTASGLGMGSDLALITVGAGRQTSGGTMYGGAITGGRTIQTPRVRSMYGLYGVEYPEEIQHLISKFIREYTEAPYLKKMTAHLDEMKESLVREDTRGRPLVGREREEPSAEDKDVDSDYDKDNPIL